jgi:hypothetical protein
VDVDRLPESAKRTTMKNIDVGPFASVLCNTVVVLMINVVNRRCGVDGCTKVAYLGLPGSRPTRCASHKDAGMVKKCAKMASTAV